jgi:uncharacterized repeat protein (TIGR03803 family)
MAHVFRYIVAACLASVLSAGSAGATTFKTLYAVRGSIDGASPNATLIKVGGTYYGTTQSGGLAGYGTVFSVDPATGAETTIYSFAGGADGVYPVAALISVGGTLYGTTIYGGTSTNGGMGTVFSINPATGDETVLHRFAGGADGANPVAPLIDVGGTLYGTTWLGGKGGGSSGAGTLFSINPATGAEAVLHSFGIGTDGIAPFTGLTNVRGTLYGTTRSGGPMGGYGLGTVFSFNPTTGAETILHNFGVSATDGQYPNSAPIEIGGTLYGTTGNGGAATCLCGTVFSIDPATGAEAVVYSFAGGSDGSTPTGLINVNGTAYGTTISGGTAVCPVNGSGGCGTVFSLNITTGTETVVYSFAGGSDGANPFAGLISAGKSLYGTTEAGGTASAGTVFSVTPAGSETVLHSFTGALYVYTPGNALLATNGTLFLSASAGGSANIGGIVQIDPSTGAATELYAFPSQEAGAYPAAALINVGGTLYGTTQSGGTGSCPAGCGTIFSIDPSTGEETLLYNFAGSLDGNNPHSALLSLGGLLYGTTNSGGTSGKGAVYSFDPASGAEAVIHSFDATGKKDAAYPQAGLINVNGTLYGTTTYGGSGRCGPGCGTVFSITPGTDAETVLLSFQKRQGVYPLAALINVGGKLYGTTTGGRYGGNLFVVDPITGAMKIIHRFGEGTDGQIPKAALINVGGTLYGTTAGGGTSRYGTVFSIDPTTGAEQVLYSFKDGSDGGEPNAALVNIGGTLYGTTSVGGDAQRGTVFELVP